MTVAGAGIHNWAGMGQDDPFQVRDIQDDFGNLGARFAELVQRLQTEPRSTVPLSTVAPSSSGQHFGMSKTERIDAQWQDRSSMPGRTNPGLLAGLLSNLSGANLKKYEGERKKLHEILDGDENIESTGWEAAGVCPTISRSPPSVGGARQATRVSQSLQTAPGPPVAEWRARLQGNRTALRPHR